MKLGKGEPDEKLIFYINYVVCCYIAERRTLDTLYSFAYYSLHLRVSFVSTNLITKN